MEFPVDLLADVSQVELEQSAHNYINNLLYSNPDLPEHLILSDSTQVTINISSVGFTPLYGLSDKHKILALFSPSDPMTAVALYLLDQWWTVDDILKTADPDRDGAMEVETLGERVVLYILNRIIYRAKEMTSEELPFLCHGEKDCAKILWNKGEAVGFYSVKPSGSIYNSSSTRSYLLPVMDSIFVRKCHRGKGFGFQMLEDFVLSSHEDCLGLRYPLTKSMYKVCQKYLCQYPEHTDLLWEVESIGGPSQRTNIARKIQAMDLSAVSKSLVFTEESVVITEMTETDVVMEAIPTQIKETESVECTVDIVEEVTVRRGTKVSEAELPVAARGRSGGSKRRNVEERITEEKSEKIIRIEDIEAETPRDEQLGAQQKTELNDGSELVQTEGMFSIGEDVVDTAPKEAATATISDTPATVLPSQDLEEDDVTATPTTVKPQVEDDLNTSHDSQITVENVASEIEEAEEEHKEEDSAVLVAQHVVSLSTHATSEGGEAGKTGRAVVKAIKIVQSETPRRRSQRHRKLEEEITAQDRGRVLRARTVMSTATPKRNSTRHSHKVNEESEKEVDVAEENNVSSTEVLEELTVTGGKELEEIASIKEDVTTVEELKEEVKQQVEDEELTSAEETEKQEEPGVKDTVVKGSSTELPDTAKNALTEVNVDEKVTDESEKEQKGEEVEKSVVEDKQQVSDDEIEEPPVVQKRASRGRRKVTPKSTQQSEGHKKQEEERTDEADLGAGSAASEEKADEKAMDKQMEEETVDKTEENKSAEELTVVEEGTKAEEPAEDVTPSTEVKVEECMEVQEDKETEGGTETVSVMEADKDKEEDDMIQDPNTVAAASETVTPDEVDETAISVAEEPQEKDIEIPKLQKATVILVDLKTCSHLSVKEAEETPADGECSAPEKELISAEEKDISSYVAEEQAPEPKMLVLEEEDGGKQENNTEESLDATAEAETVEKQELEEDSSDKEKKESANVDGEMSEAEEAPFVEARVLRSGRKLVKETYQQYNIGDVVTEKEVDEAEPGNGEVEGEKEVTGKDAVAVTVPVEEKPSAESLSKICADTEPDIPVVDDTEDNLPPAEGDDAISLEEDETPGGTKTPRCKTTRKQADEQEAESSEEEETAVTTRTLSRGRESASATPKGKSRRSRKQEEEQKGAEESKKIEETGGDEGKAPEEDQMEVEEEEPLPVEVKEASIEERGEKNEREIEAVSKKEESVEQTIDVEEGKAVAEEGQYVEEEQLEAIVASAQKTLQEEEDGPKESAKEAEVEEEKEEEEEEEGLGSAKEPLTEVDEAPEEDKTEVEKEELVPVEVEKGVSEEGTMTEEEENTAGEAATADDLVQEGDIDTPSTKPAADSAIRTPSEEEPTPSAEEQHSEEILPKLPDLQRVSVVVVDLKKTNHEVQEEMATVEEGVPGEKTAAEEEEKVEETTKTEEIMAEDQVPGSLVGIEKTESEKVVVEEEGFEEKAEDAVAIQDTAGETAKQDEAKTVDADDEEEELTVAEIRALRGKKKAVKATPTRKLARGRQKKGVEEKEETTEIREEEPAVEVRVLRRGRKSIPVTPRCTTKRTHKHIQEEQEEEEEEEGGEESTAVERQAEEQAEEQQQTIDQEEGERVEVKNASQQAENIEPEKVDPVSEEGQASSSETEAPVGADEGKTLDDAAEEAVTVPDTVEGEQSTSIAEPAPLTAKDDEAEGVSEEEPPVIEPRVLRSGEETVKATARSKTTKRDQQDKEATGEKSTEEESAVGTRVLRKGRRSAPATPRRKSKRPRTQCQPEEEGEEETTHAEETEGEEEEAGQELHEEKCEMAEEEGKSVEMGLKEDKDVEKEEAECVAGKESTPAEEMQAGEVKAALEKSTEKEENKDEKIEDEAAAEKEENTEPEEDNEQEEEAAGERSTEDEVAVETRVLRKGRRSAPATPKRKSKRARRQCQTEDDGENKATLAEDIQIEESKTDEKKDNSDEKTQEKDGEEPVANEEDNTETKIEFKKVEAVLEESLPEQETAEEEQPAETHAHGQEETPVVESAEETPNTDEGKVTDEEEASVVETRVLRSGGKAVKAAQRSKTAKKQQEETEQEGTVVEKSADTDTEPAIETRVLKKGRRSAPATPRRKSKRARTQCQPEEEGDGTTPGEETEGEEEEAGHELPEVKGEKAEEEGMSMEVGVKKDKDVEEDKVESVAGGESAEQITDTLTDEAAVLEKEDNNMAAGDETGTDMVEVEEIKSAKEEGTTVTEKSTAAAEMGSHTAIVEGEALAANESVVAEEQALAVTTRTLRSKTKTSLATSLQRSRKQKGQGAVEQEEQEEQEEETPEDEETEEVHQFTDDSPENGEQEETDETLPTGQEAGPPAEDNAEDQAKEIADDRLVESAGEEPETEEMESLEEEPSESKEDKPQDSSEVESRSLRGKRKTVADKEDIAEEIQLPKRRSVRKRPRVDYKENDEEDEGGETEAATDKEEENTVESDKDKDDKEAEGPADEPELEESSREDNLQNNVGAVESTGEKGDIINLILDIDEEVETAGIRPEDEEDEGSMSEEEEPKVIGKRVLRGRSIPSIIITPHSKSRHRSPKVKKAEESLFDEEKSPQSSQKRSLRKRKSTGVTPTRKSKRHSRV